MAEGGGEGVAGEGAALLDLFPLRRVLSGGDLGDDVGGGGAETREGEGELAVLGHGGGEEPLVARFEAGELVGAGGGGRVEGILFVGAALGKGEGLEVAAVFHVGDGGQDFGGEDVAGGVVEEVSQGDVEGGRDDVVVGQGLGVDELGVAAGDEEGEEGEFWRCAVGGLLLLVGPL